MKKAIGSEPAGGSETGGCRIVDLGDYGGIRRGRGRRLIRRRPGLPLRACGALVGGLDGRIEFDLPYGLRPDAGRRPYRDKTIIGDTRATRRFVLLRRAARTKQKEAADRGSAASA
jgi:hypothetical protein